MSQVVSGILILGTIGTGIVEDLASETSWDVLRSPSSSWDCWDWDSRGSSLLDLFGCPKYRLRLLVLGF